jgi:hypothetical protein
MNAPPNQRVDVEYEIYIVISIIGYEKFISRWRCTPTTAGPAAVGL